MKIEDLKAIIFIIAVLFSSAYIGVNSSILLSQREDQRATAAIMSARDVGSNVFSSDPVSSTSPF